MSYQPKMQQEQARHFFHREIHDISQRLRHAQGPAAYTLHSRKPAGKDTRTTQADMSSHTHTWFHKHRVTDRDHHDTEQLIVCLVSHINHSQSLDSPFSQSSITWLTRGSLTVITIGYLGTKILYKRCKCVKLEGIFTIKHIWQSDKVYHEGRGSLSCSVQLGEKWYSVMGMMRNETGHESHALIFLDAALTFMRFLLSVSISQ